MRPSNSRSASVSSLIASAAPQNSVPECHVDVSTNDHEADSVAIPFQSMNRTEDAYQFSHTMNGVRFFGTVINEKVDKSFELDATDVATGKLVSPSQKAPFNHSGFASISVSHGLMDYVVWCK